MYHSPNITFMKILSVLALFGLSLSIIVHYSTFFATDLSQSFDSVWLLHWGFFVFFVPLILVAKTQKKQNFLSHLPPWSKIIIILLFIYAIINIFLCIFASSEGQPSFQDGKYILINQSRIIREITHEEYHHYHAIIMRLFSGHWMLFYFFPSVYFWYYKKAFI